MKSITTTFNPSVGSYGASTSNSSNSHYNGRQAFCPGAGWMAWGYVAMLRKLNTADMPQA